MYPERKNYLLVYLQTVTISFRKLIWCILIQSGDFAILFRVIRTEEKLRYLLSRINRMGNILPVPTQEDYPAAFTFISLPQKVTRE